VPSQRLVDLPLAGALDGTELYYSVQGGNNVKVPGSVLCVTAVNAKSFGAVGNGVADDTTALQNAINYAITNLRSLYIPGGVYKTTATLTVDISGLSSGSRGFQMFGDGDGIGVTLGGTNIVLFGAGPFTSVMSVYCYRNAYLHDFSVGCNTPGAATYGILMPEANTSTLKFARLSANSVSVAYAQNWATFQDNGEFHLFESCGARNVDKFWYSNSGQSYIPCFISCSCILNYGGVYFDMDMSTGAGGGINVLQFDGSPLPIGGCSSSTLVRCTDVTSCINFVGGRVESLTRVLNNLSSSDTEFIAPRFESVQFTCDNDTTNVNNTLKSWINSTAANHYDSIVFQNCIFEGISSNNISFNITPFADWVAQLHYESCVFNRININPTTGLPTNVKFDDCWWQTATSVHVSNFMDGLSTTPPNTQTTDYTVQSTNGVYDTYIIANGVGTITLTLPSASDFPGRIITVRTIQNQAVVSASANVVPITGGGAVAAILPATTGKWVDLQASGSVWLTLRSN
jgi:hypothetical protein